VQASVRLKDDSQGGRYRHFSDAGLVALMSRNDLGSLGALFERFGHLAYGLAFEIVRDERLAEDIVCEAFVQLWRSASAHPRDAAAPRAQVLAYIQRVSRNARARNRTTLETERDSGSHDNPPWITLDRESAERVLALLHADDRSAVELAYYAGRSRTEIAHQLVLPIETITQRVRSGMHALAHHAAPDLSVLG
jgi:RNA polymerase sigma-70 factor (ECF subfamily)